MTYGQHLASLIDKTVEDDNPEDGLRTHLGASIIGNKCMRAVWFSFRWTSTEKMPGRIVRLLEHGEREEDIFAKHLRRQGATVYQIDPTTNKQFRMAAFGGHFGGSCDGVAIKLPDLPVDMPVLLELKTHNENWFSQLEKKGVESTKPEHVRQAQAYMHVFNTEKGWKIPKALYGALNKNDESLHFELLDYDPELGQRMVDRAEAVIFGRGMPARISDKPTHWECKFCPHHSVCFKYKPAFVNCRTCAHSTPLRDGTWSCAKGRPEIGTQPKLGCGEHEYMAELV